MTPHTCRPPEPMTREWLHEEIRRQGLRGVASDQWGGEEELILAALKCGPTHTEAPTYDGLRRALIQALVMSQRGLIEEAEHVLAKAIRASAYRDRKTPG
jgi:hypothetical protein